MTTMAERTFGYVVTGLLSPAQTPPKMLTKLVGTVAIGLLVLVLILALPPVKDRTYCLAFSGTENITKEHIKNWCDFITVACQMLIAMTIGGVVFTNSIADWIRDRSALIQNRLHGISDMLVDNTPNGPRTEKQEELRNYMKQIDALKIGIDSHNFVDRMHQVCRIIDQMYKLLVPDAPILNFLVRHFLHVPFPFNKIPGFRDNRIFILLSMRYGIAFPGGLYGLFAYFAFLIMTGSVVLKTYFDYSPVCTS